MKTHCNLFACVLITAIVFATVPAIAQDPVKVAPDKVKVKLDNDKVRVLEFVVKAGEKTGMHSHPAHVLYLLSDAKMKTTLSDGKVTETDAKAGDARWVEAVTHDNENRGSADIHALVIEIKAPKKK